MTYAVTSRRTRFVPHVGPSRKRKRRLLLTQGAIVSASSLLAATLGPSSLSRRKRKELTPMFLILAVLLVLTWVLGLVVLKAASLLIHLLLLFAILFGVFHFMRG
jgi:hypothetical protein